MKIRKNAFTLVELLAVIAILAILIIIALPNVLKMFKKAKENSFVNEVRSTFRTAEQKFIADGGKGIIPYNEDIVLYTNVSVEDFINGIEPGEGESLSEESIEEIRNILSQINLNMSGRKDLFYFIMLNKNGEVYLTIVGDKNYSIRKTAEFEANCSYPTLIKGVNVDEITSDDIREPIDNLGETFYELMNELQDKVCPAGNELD
ncbi:MAG: prepilin-type N-terminal cleavage/methylation domain-containing protein [Tenericutes bacterium]|nr:prepilin-type N-terminal cleavage/methylation domain-containing protein [Mycoplasmatota bacterium]